MRAAGILFTITAAIAIIIFTGIWLDFLITSKGEISPFYDENGKRIPDSIAEKTWVEINGAENGMILRGKNVDNPVLLFLSGGPGVPQYWLNEYYPNELEEHYTVCWWDYYGEGLSWQPGIAPGEIAMQRLEEDGVSVAEYLRERFGKEKIYLMAHSAGTPLGFKLAKEHPELFYAYYGMGQIAEGEADRYDYGYAFLKQTFTEKQDKRGLSRLEALVSILCYWSGHFGNRAFAAFLPWNHLCADSESIFVIGICENKNVSGYGTAAKEKGDEIVLFQKPC